MHVGFLSTMFESLSSDEYRKFWIGLVLFMSATQMHLISRGVLAYDITGNRFQTGIVSIGFAPSMLLFSLFGGAIGERIDKRLIIQLTLTVSFLSSIIIAFLITFDAIHWTHLLAGSAVQGAMFALQSPARQAAISSMVKKNQVSNAISLSAMATSLTTVAAPGIGGLLYGFLGPGIVYFIVSGLVLASIVSTSLMTPKPPMQDAKKEAMRDAILAGIKYISRRRVLWMLVFQTIVVALLSFPFRMLIQVFAKDVYGSLPEHVGLLLTAGGVGGLFGSLVIASLRSGNRRGLVLLISSFISAGALGIMAVAPFYPAGLIGMVLLGLGEAGRLALGQSLLMEHTEERYKARVMSLFFMTFGLMPLGVLPLTIAMDNLGGQLSAAVMGGVLLLMSALFLIPPTIRKLD